MINEKELIMEMENWQQTLIPHSDSGDKYMYDILEDVIEVINEQPKVGEWVLCSWWPPEPYETVLVTAKMPEDKEPLVYMGSVDGVGNWTLIGVKNGEDYDVIAWKPLPEPRKGEEKK